jgi:hypothetical protein
MFGRPIGANAIDHASDLHLGPAREIERRQFQPRETTAESRRITERLPRALDEIYPLPSRVPDDLRSLIDAVADATRRRSSR